MTMTNATRMKVRYRSLRGLLSSSTGALAKSSGLDVFFIIPSQSITDLVPQTSDSLTQEGISTFFDKG